MHRPRRRVLAAAATALGSLAGCLRTRTTGPADGGDGGSDGSSEGDADGGDATTAGATTAAPTPADEGSPDAGDLDLREANVTGVSVEPDGDDYRFDVTLYHDDDGEDGYANWWQVESYGGERLGRRELLHAHGTQEFTRSATVSLPSGTRCVVVRGHDQTHGYGGRAMLVDVETGEADPLDQGPDPTSPVDADCPVGGEG